MESSLKFVFCRVLMQKNQKPARKAKKKWLRQEIDDCCDKFHLCHNKNQGTKLTECRNIPNLYHDTIPVRKQKRFVATFCNYVTKKNKANGRKTLSQQ